MADLKKYKIDVFNLSPGEYEYDFRFKSDFFKNFENSLVENGKGSIFVTLRKSETFLDVDLSIDASIDLICDRSLDEFEFPVILDKHIIFKFGEEDDLIDDDEIVFIPWNTQTLYLGQYIYEFISLAIPMKKLHPRFWNEEEDDDLQEDKLIYSSESDTESQDNDGMKIDPRWESLNNLRSDN